MASCPITSWQIHGEPVEIMADFIFLGSKITVDGDCSYEMKRRLLLGREIMTNLHSILKSRNITLSTKFHLVKAMVFPVVMYRCECLRIDVCEFWYWRIPWIARRANQSILRKIGPGCSLEGLIKAETSTLATWCTWIWVNSGSWWWKGSLVCYNKWGCKDSDMTEWMNWLNWLDFVTYKTQLFPVI